MISPNLCYYVHKYVYCKRKVSYGFLNIWVFYYFVITIEAELRAIYLNPSCVTDPINVPFPSQFTYHISSDSSLLYWNLVMKQQLLQWLEIKRRTQFHLTFL